MSSKACASVKHAFYNLMDGLVSLEVFTRICQEAYNIVSKDQNVTDRELMYMDPELYDLFITKYPDHPFSKLIALFKSL